MLAGKDNMVEFKKAPATKIPEEKGVSVSLLIKQTHDRINSDCYDKIPVEVTGRKALNTIQTYWKNVQKAHDHQ